MATRHLSAQTRSCELAALVKIAVIGGGIAGIVAAHRLQGQHEVTLFESASQLGGHAHGVEVAPGVFADTGVIIYNQGSYPEFISFLRELGVEGSCFRMEMSLSFNNLASGRSFALGTKPFPLAGSLRHLLSPKTFKVLRELWRFYQEGKVYLQEVEGSGLGLQDFLHGKGFSKIFLDELLFPLAMSVWSLPRGYFRQIEAELFLRFLDHHRCLGGDLKNYHWYTFAGSTRMYLQRFIDGFKGSIQYNSRITAVRRAGSGAVIELAGALSPQTFDHVILATHADTALSLIVDPLPVERQALGQWQYHTTKVYLHQDPSFAPTALRASWNIFFGDRPAQEWITYDINHIQKLPVNERFFVTLSNERRPQRIVEEMEFAHPIFDQKTTAKFEALKELNQTGALSFCGSYFGYGFHEDAIRSANLVAKRLNDE